MKKTKPPNSALFCRRDAWGFCRESLRRICLFQYGVFKRFCSAQTHDSLGLDLDSFTRCRIAAHTCLTMRLHRAAETRNYEFARSLCFFHSQFEELVKERRDLLFGPRLF